MFQKEVFNLKEVEKLAGKAGVVLQTVKDVVQSLVDDSLVCQDKVGSMNVFWAFRSSAIAAKARQVTAQRAAAEADEAAVTELQARVAAMEAERTETPERAAKVARWKELTAAKTALSGELALYRANDPEVIKEIQGKIRTAKTAADRWTDNAWCLRDHLVKKLGVDRSQADRMLGITSEFDYVA